MAKVNYIEINEKAYDRLWTYYKTRAEQKSHYEEKPSILGGAILELATKTFKDISVLEIGPGSGEILAFFEKSHCKTFAVDISGKMASLAKAKSPKTIIVVSDILRICFLDSQFEIIYAGALIHLFSLVDARMLLKKIYKWLKPDGYLFINTTVHKRSKQGFYKKSDYKGEVVRFRRYWTEYEFEEEITKAGFIIRDKLYTDEKDRQKKWIAFLAQKRD